jgi:hypothetical protein
MKESWNVGKNLGLAALVLGTARAVPGGAAVLHVPADYRTIQAAVNAAASNDTVRIAAGVYVEQVVITNKTLTLAGSPGAILRARAQMGQPFLAYGSEGSGSVPLLGIAMGNVVVTGLTFEGERLASSQPQSLDAIKFFGAGGRVENCRITGFRASALGAVDAVGISVVNPLVLGQGVVDVQVINNTFADNWSSLWLMGDARTWPPPGVFHPEVLRTTFTVQGNTFTGVGPNADPGLRGGVMQAGIWILAGARGDILHNVFSDYAYAGTDPTVAALGIFGLDDQDFGDAPIKPLQPVRISGNSFQNNDVHVGIFLADQSEISNNAFTGSGMGVRPSGIVVSGNQPLIVRNRFSDLATGILVLGDDPVFGTNLGSSTNVQIDSNRFCNVTNKVDIELPATTTEQSTMTCPFPPPPLGIARAVMLSWPDDGEAHILESAPDLAGPWSTMNASLALQNGELTVAVKTESDQRFFRLH